MIPAGITSFSGCFNRLGGQRLIVVESRERNDPVGFIKCVLMRTEADTKENGLFTELFQVYRTWVSINE